MKKGEKKMNNNMKFAAPLGRLLYSLIFIMAGLGHFSKPTIEFAASQGVPFASFAVPLSGLIAIAGGLSIALGYQTRIGALLIAIFLVPVTLMMHAFWKISDPMMQQIQMAMFMKNVSMLGGALAFVYFGAGPVSVDSRKVNSERHQETNSLIAKGMVKS
jgi:putative oxidoreductase